MTYWKLKAKSKCSDNFIPLQKIIPPNLRNARIFKGCGGFFVEEVAKSGGNKENIDSKPAVTDIPEYVEVAPAEDTAKTSSSEPVAETTNQPAETTVSPAVNDDGQPVSAEENGSKSVIDRNKGYTTSTDAQGNTVILDDKGKQVNADDIVTSAVESAESKQKKSNVLPIVLVVSAFAVAAAVVIIILKRKK